jgi:hypothetical protein
MERPMKITKQRLKEIIREELTAEGSREDMMMPAISMADMEAAMAADDAGLGDLQSDEKFTGGSPEERLLTLMKAREVLAAMSREELAALSKSLDAPMLATLRHILANPMYAPMQEGQDEDEELLSRLKQKYGRKADHFTVEDIQDLHPSYKGSLRDVAQGLGIRL